MSCNQQLQSEKDEVSSGFKIYVDWKDLGECEINVKTSERNRIEHTLLDHQNPLPVLGGNQVSYTFLNKLVK